MYLIISIFLVIFALILSYFATRNIFSVVFISGGFLTLSFIGCCLLVGPPYYPLPFYFSLSMLSLALGAFFANELKRFSPSRELDRFRELKINSPFKFDTPFSLAFLSLVILNILAISYLFLKTGIPFFAEIPEVAKVEMAGSSNWLLVRCLRYFLPILLLILFLYQYKTKKNLTRMGFLFLLLLLAVIYLFYGWKGYFFAYVGIPLLMLYALMGKIKIRDLVLLFFLGLLAAIPLYSGMLKTTDFRVILNAIFNRLTVAQALGVNWVVTNLVPKEGLFYGATFKMDIERILYVVGISKEEALSFAGFLVKYETGENPGGRLAVAPSLFGELYANFGLFFGILGIFFAGFFLHLLYIKTLRSSKNIFYLPFYIFFQLALFFAIVNGHTFITLIDIGLFTIILLFLLIIFYIFFELPTGRIILLRKNMFIKINSKKENLFEKKERY